MQINVNNLKKCSSFKNRLLGLMFQKEITPLCFPKCNSIHTFFMRKKIDVIMCNRDDIVVGIYLNTKKNRIIINHNAYYTYELPVGLYQIKIGDTIRHP